MPRLILPFLTLVFLLVGSQLLLHGVREAELPPPQHFSGVLHEAGIAPTAKRGDNFRFRLIGVDDEYFSVAYGLQRRPELRALLLAELRDGRRVEVETFALDPEQWRPHGVPQEVRRILADGQVLFDEREWRERGVWEAWLFGLVGGLFCLIGVGLGYLAWRLRSRGEQR